eukprot:TRINITY_DN1651_c0_g1_i2.p1 TRINITY_DN1651_c0_g1~~TRINITY_DN1651_c0_g1_i2.p1  ORF type:complete len:331 (+),score=16.22 TRINITY_DN1651_c0_g1_i2:92-1084(+)
MKVLEVSRSNLDTQKHIFKECVRDLKQELESERNNSTYAELLKGNLTECFSDLKKFYHSYGASISPVERDAVLLEQRESQKALNAILEEYLYTKDNFKMSRDISPDSDSDSDSETGHEEAMKLHQDAFGSALNKGVMLPYSTNSNIKKVGNVGLRTVWHDSSTYDTLLKQLKFGDCLEIKKMYSSNHWAVYVGDFFEDGDKCIVFIKGDTFFGLFSSEANKRICFIPLAQAIKNKDIRINNQMDNTLSPSSYDFILRKIENEVESLDRAYNYFSFNDEHFAKYIRNHEETEGAIMKAIDRIAQSTMRLVVSKITNSFSLGFNSLKALLWG